MNEPLMYHLLKHIIDIEETDVRLQNLMDQLEKEASNIDSLPAELHYSISILISFIKNNILLR